MTPIHLRHNGLFLRFIRSFGTQPRQLSSCSLLEAFLLAALSFVFLVGVCLVTLGMVGLGLYADVYHYACGGLPPGLSAYTILGANIFLALTVAIACGAMSYWLEDVANRLDDESHDLGVLAAVQEKLQPFVRLLSAWKQRYCAPVVVDGEPEPWPDF
jgi:hypothetical protein